MVYVTIPGGPDESTVDDFIRSLDDLLDRSEPFCMLADFTQTEGLGLLVVQRVATYAKRSGHRLDELCAALAFVIPSRFVRSAMKVVFHLEAPGHPYRIVSTREDAHSYLAPYLSELR